jgi:hypothetical protein
MQATKWERNVPELRDSDVGTWPDEAVAHPDGTGGGGHRGDHGCGNRVLEHSGRSPSGRGEP